jgi:hypothetical protein
LNLDVEKLSAGIALNQTFIIGIDILMQIDGVPTTDAIQPQDR